jgi:ABC-type transport system involved in cytochrome c biogenesis permease subunit
MSVSLLQPYFFMSKTKSYAQILIGSWLFLTAMAIYLSLWVAPPDFQQGGNSRILYVHVPVAWMSIVIYIATAINSSLFPLTKHPLFLLVLCHNAYSGTSTTFFYKNNLQADDFPTLTTNSPTTSLAYQSSKHRKSNFGNLTKQATD